MHSLKTKLIAGISALLVFLFSVTAVLLMREKRNELSRDIYVNARAFSELSTPKVVDLYTSLLAEESFVIFTREMKDVFNKNEDVADIALHTFAGQTLYDSSTERERHYVGDERQVENPILAERIKATLPSLLLTTGRVVYLKKTADGIYVTVDANERAIPDLESSDEIVNIVHPFGEKYAVEFTVSYENLRTRVLHMVERIALLLIFGILIGLAAALSLASRITKPIEKLKEGAITIGKGDFTARVTVQTKDEVGLLAETFNKMAGDLEISTKAMIERERIGKELELAAKIQRQILPKTVPNIPGLQLSTALHPAQEVGGDCFDFLKVSEDNHIIYISDVTGHGVPSGLVVSIANALIYSYADAPTIVELLTHTNHVLKQKTSQNMFMTLLMVRWSAGKLSYVSAGHPPMLHYYGKEQKVVEEKSGGIALGMIPDISKTLVENTIPFNSGDVIVLYSDGFPEGVNEHGEMYGMPRFKRALADAAQIDNIEAIKYALVADAKLFMGKAEQLDDMTLVVIRKT